mgnify:CR=1 FL=1
MAVHGRFLPLSQLALACTALCCKTVSYMHRIACKVREEYEGMEYELWLYASDNRTLSRVLDRCGDSLGVDSFKDICILAAVFNSRCRK